MDRLIEDEANRKMLIRYLEQQKLPFTVKVDAGRKRSVEQNKLQRLWINEIAEQWEGHTAEYIRAYCKIAIGVPILRAASDKFREAYDREIKPLPWERKVALFMEPIDIPITRLFTSKQKTEYLDGVFKHFTEKGFELTQPEDRQAAA